MLCEITVKYYISVIYSKTTIHQCGKVKYATELGHLCGSGRNIMELKSILFKFHKYSKELGVGVWHKFM